MDLSQQELPLTTYFTRNTKEVRPRTVRRKTARPVEVSQLQSPGRSPKRRRTTASSSKSHADPSKPSPTTLQLSTPAASAKKRLRGRQLPGITSVATLSSAEPNTTLSSKKGLAQPDSGSAPSRLPQSLGEHVEAVSEATLATPSTSRERTTEPTGIVFSPRCRLPNNTETSLITPRTLSWRAPKTMHDIRDQSPLAHSNCRSFPKPSQVTPISSCSPVAVDCHDPFHTCKKNSSTLLPREDPSLPLERCFIQSETPNGQASDDPFISAIPVPSSQSQYLLHLDATPKHKRYPRRIDHVVSSQTQEEVELTLAMSRNPVATVSLLVSHTPATLTPSINVRVSRVSSSKRKSQGHFLHSVPIGSSNSPDSSRCVAKNKTLNERSSKLSSPTRRNTSTPSHSPSCKDQRKTLQSPTRHESIENIPPTHTEEDSLTESESDLDIVQVPRLLVPKDSCISIRSGSVQGNLPSTEDGSATEAESDTEFHRCLAEIGRKSHVMHHPRVSKEHPPPPPVISPLVSPARPRLATGPPNMDFTQFSEQEGAGLSVPGSCVPFALALEQIQAGAGSLPSIVRDFVHMFPGDESYPADFPESLRV